MPPNYDEANTVLFLLLQLLRSDLTKLANNESGASLSKAELSTFIPRVTNAMATLGRATNTTSTAETEQIQSETLAIIRQLDQHPPEGEQA